MVSYQEYSLTHSTHQEYMCCTGHQRAKGWIKQWEGTRGDARAETYIHLHALRTAAPIFARAARMRTQAARAPSRRVARC